MATHWLELVAHRAKVPYANDLMITPGAATVAAWEETLTQLRIGEDELARHIAAFFHIKVADLDSAVSSATKLVPDRLIQQYNVLPLRHTDREIVVATYDPGDMGAEQALGFAAGRTAVFEVATPTALRRAIASHYARDRPERDGETRQPPTGRDAAPSLERDLAGARTGESNAVNRLTQLIIQEAVVRRATDISIYPAENGGVVALRVDAMPQHLMNLPLTAMNFVVGRLRVLGQTGVSDRRLSREGSAHVDVDGRDVVLRIRTTPVHGTHRADVRLTDPLEQRTLEHLGFAPADVERLRALLTQPTGLIVIAGLQGSGRSTLRYAMLRELSRAGRKAVSVEDQITEDLAGIQQIETAPAQGATAAKLVESALRHEPAVLAIDEVTDAVTARQASDAAGNRLVIVALRAAHTLDAIARLSQLGIDRARMASVLRGTVALRLMRRLCSACAQPARAPRDDAERDLAATFALQEAPVAVGCEACCATGYSGVMPLAEILVADDAFRARIRDGASLQEIGRAAVAAGARSAKVVGLERVRHGASDLRELDRVLGSRPPAARLAAAGPRVLVADDEPETRLFARAVLERAGFAVSEAVDGEAVLEQVRASSDFALLILDLNMPRLDGRETLARLKRRVETAALPVLVFTASADPRDEQRIMDEGADDYVRKPLDPERFISRVRAVLARHAVEPATHG